GTREFCRAQCPDTRFPAGQKNLAVLQPHRLVVGASYIQISSAMPLTSHRVVDLAGGEKVIISIRAACDQYLAIRQQSRSMKLAGVGQVTRSAPPPRDRILQFRACPG